MKIFSFLLLLTIALFAWPVHAATFTVSNTLDAGAGSLRQAIIDAQNTPGADTINVTVTGTVLLASALPEITQSLTINGGSQTGFIVSGNTAVRPFSTKGSGITVNFNDLTITAGSSPGGTPGGGIYAFQNTINLVNVVVSYSICNGSLGGGVAIHGGALNVTNSTIDNNTATGNGAGGIYASETTVEVTNSRITNNQSPYQGGGGMYVSAGSGDITGTIFEGNACGNGDGGGLLVGVGAVVRVMNSTLNNNRCAFGGGIGNSNSTLFLINTTVSGNNATSGGAGIYSFGTTTIRNSTIADNAANVFAGGIRVAGTVTIANTIVAGNTAPSGAEIYDDSNGEINTRGVNIIQGSTSGTITVVNGSNITGVSPQLLPLGTYGSNLVTIRAIEATSNACNAGDNAEALDSFDVALTSDARGATRPQAGTVDIGAFELSAPLISPFTLPASTVGQAYNSPLTASGGTAPYNFSLISGAVPPGLTLNSNGTWTGTTTTPGTSAFRVQVQDASSHTAVRDYQVKVFSPVNLTGTKTVSGTFIPGNTITYAITLANSGQAIQFDNPGNEFIDVLPSRLNLVSATATTGTSVATTGTNTVTWNGSLAKGDSVTITITASIKSGSGGQTVSNQGAISYDADGDGTNEATGLTDDPTIGGASDSTTFVVSKLDQTITFTPIGPKTFGDSPINASATATSGLPVSFSILSGPATVGGNTVTTTGVGTVIIRALQAGDTNFNPAPSVDQSFTVSKANQTITFGALANKMFGDADFNVSATASSGLAVGFAASGQCTVSGNTVHITGAGSCTMAASQTGNSNYNAAPDVNQSFEIAKRDQTITFDPNPLPARTFGDADFDVVASANSGLAVNFATSGQCTISGAKVQLTGGGTCTLTASQNGNSNYNSAPPVVRSFSINKSNQTITFGALANKNFGDPDFIVNATASSNLPVDFSASGACIVTGNTVHISGAGSCTITASQIGDANYNRAPDIGRTFSTAKAAQTITFSALANKTFGDADFSLNATSSSGLVVSFAAVGPCTVVAGSAAHISGPGSCTITASQSGNADFNPAIDVARRFDIAKAATTTVVSSSFNPSGVTQSVTFTANVTSTAGNPTGALQFKDNGASLGALVTLNGNGQAQLITSALAAGAHVITAEYSGDANFATSSGDLAGGQTVNNTAFISLSQITYNVVESAGFVRVTVNRSGDTSVPVNVDYATSDDSGPGSGPCVNGTGQASSRCDFNSAFGTLKFGANETAKTFDVLITMDSFTEGPEVFTITLSNQTGGASFTIPSNATVIISDGTSLLPRNAIDDTATFVRQQYHDFLNREADTAGLNFWVDNIDKCNDPLRRPAGQSVEQCIDVQRVTTSGAFFLSIEFRETGGLVRDFYVAALNRPNNRPTFVEFERDMQAVGQDVVVNKGSWEKILANNQDVFMKDFVMRAEFVGLYPTTDLPGIYVSKLYEHALGRTPTASELQAGIAEFGSASTAADPVARGRALRRVTQAADFQQRELNCGFVEIQYFGYLRRNANDLPDGNFTGADFWLNKLNKFGGDYIQAQMVKAFEVSLEYRARFGP